MAMGSPDVQKNNFNMLKRTSNIEINEDCLKKLEHQLILEGISNQLFFSSAFDRLTHAHVETCGSNSQHIAEGEPRDPCFEKEADVVQLPWSHGRFPNFGAAFGAPQPSTAERWLRFGALNVGLFTFTSAANEARRWSEATASSARSSGI